MVNEAVEVLYLRGIPGLPLLAGLVLGVAAGFLRARLSRLVVVGLSALSLAGSLLLSVVAFARLVGAEAPRTLIDPIATWIGVGVGRTVFSADLALQFDPLSAVLVLLSTGLGLLVLVYSVGYLDATVRDDGGLARYFAYFDLSLASLLLLLMADNLLVLLLGWQALALFSSLLIAFWYTEEANARAANAAFIVNRVGDAGLIGGIGLLFWATSEAGIPTVTLRMLSLHFDEIAEMTLRSPWGSEWSLPGVVALLFLLAAAARSAQFPLHVWLPRAMAAPTPVAALLYSAGMVTTGVYLVCRLWFLFAAAPEASALAAWLGAVTTLVAGFFALAQTDLKKVLAYGAMAQLGLMFVGLGSGAYTAALYHAVTQAFFQTLLYLSAGAVLVSLRGRRDMREMGGIRSKLPRVHVSMWIGVLAVAGLPPFSGFFSRDAILSATYGSALPGARLLWSVGIVATFLASLAMFRMLFLTFHGQTRMPPERRMTLRDPSDWLIHPMYLLWPLAIFGWLLGPSQFWGDLLGGGIDDSDSLGRFVARVVPPTPVSELSRADAWQRIGIAMLAAIAGPLLAAQLYLRRPDLRERLTERLGWLTRRFVERPFVEVSYERFLVQPLWRGARRFARRGLEERALEGFLVSGLAGLLRFLSTRVLRRLHDGLVQTAMLAVLLGAAFVVAFLLAGGA